MKKVYTTPRFKKYNKRKSEEGASEKPHRKNSGILNGARRSPPESQSSFFYSPKISKPPLNIAKAPENFSLIENTESVLHFFQEAYKKLKSKKRIFFDISNIKRLTTDAIAVFVAKINDENFHCKTGLMGNEPHDQEVKNIFIQSGFYEHVSIKGSRPKNDKKLLIHKLTNNRVEPDIAKDACLIGLRHTFQNENIFEPLYDILIEVMQNTNNHAGETRGVYDWWLQVYTHQGSSKTSYTFIDLGVGIFESLPVRSFKREVLDFIGITSNLDLVSKLFAGDIKSRTARPERGKGIPQVYECSQNATFEKFILISNDVYADLKTNDYKLLKQEFSGTLFYWEINTNTTNGN
jgi:hypothetical protein